MRPDRLRFPRLGLRGRLIAALVLTSLVTLAAVALALLTPLEEQLTRDRLDTLESQILALRPAFSRLAPDQVRPNSPVLVRLARTLRRRSGGEIAIFDDRGRLVTATDVETGPPANAARAALGERRLIRRVVNTPEEREAIVAARADTRTGSVVVTVQKSIEDVQAATSGVQRSFAIAAAIGLTVATLIGIGLATGLVRRLKELRHATLKVAELGPEVELAGDRSRDEVGDLTRAFVTLQARLREQEQARRTFVATASHELRTPLSSLALMLDMLEEDLAEGHVELEQARKQVQEARGQSDRLSKLAAELLDLSRIDAGVPLGSELVDLRELTRAVLSEFEPRSPGALELEASEPCWAVADPGSVARVVRILVDNALRFTPPGERVRVEVSCADGISTLAVADSGPGVPEAERELIFERFQRGTETGDTGGFGLGLAIGRELAVRMEGDLRLDSEAQGARFVLTLPGAPDLARSPAQSA
jgi:signal transduction histidine kinase